MTGKAGHLFVAGFVDCPANDIPYGIGLGDIKYDLVQFLILNVSEGNWVAFHII